MAKFIYIADTHFASDGAGYQQQKIYQNQIKEILVALDDYIKQDSDIEFVLHGGDMIDSTSEENIKGASEFFKLSVPVYLCLGNHDLTTQNALELWLKIAPEFFPTCKPDYSLQIEDKFIHVITNQWADIPYYWDRGNCSQRKFSVNQYEPPASADNQSENILCTHSNVIGIPPEQTGFGDWFHVPPESLYNDAYLFIRENNIKYVMSGHTHINSHSVKNDIHYITASSLTEVPFEFKLFEIGPDGLKMSTISLDKNTNFKSEYDYNKTFVQGREKDRII